MRGMTWAAVTLLVIVGTPRSEAMEHLSANLVPFIGERDVSMVLVRIASVRSSVAPGSDRESGRLAAEVVEVFRSPGIRLKDQLEIPFERAADRLARVHQGFDHWNKLPLEADRLVVFALKPLEPPKVWTGLAASAVESVTSPDVVAVREAFRIEHAQPADRPHLLEQALTRGPELLTLYVLEAVGRRRMVPRTAGVDLLDRTLMAPGASRQVKEAIVGYLTRGFFFDDRLGVDHDNVRIVGAVAREMVRDADPKARTLWLKYLGSCVLGSFGRDPEQDRSTRLTLVKAVTVPAPDNVIAVLSELAQMGPDGERRIAQRLLDVWRAANGAQR
jgi:hypothetical protein